MSSAAPAISRTADVIVLGLGGMGSAAAFHLAKRGAKVIGFDAHALAHDRGSSHGESRLIRKAYFESPAYVPLLERAYTLWDELAADAEEPHLERPLLERTGLLLFGRKGGPRDRTARALAVAREHALVVEELSATESRARFPAFVIPDDFEALWEPGAGFLHVERCVRAHANGSIKRGALLQFGAKVDRWTASATSVEVVSHGVTYRAPKLVICPGPWAAQPNALGDLGLPLAVHRVVQFWFDAKAALAVGAGMPCYAFDVDGVFVYGFPRLADGRMKIAQHAPGALVTDPALCDRSVAAHEADLVKQFTRTYFEGVGAEPVAAKTCLYTMTPDEHFIVDAHPLYNNVYYACGFSGHGFKFASVIGETLAQLVFDGNATLPVAFLKNRFGTTS